jgi:hypothetical protein
LAADAGVGVSGRSSKGNAEVLEIAALDWVDSVAEDGLLPAFSAGSIRFGSAPETSSASLRRELISLKSDSISKE